MGVVCRDGECSLVIFEVNVNWAKYGMIGQIRVSSTWVPQITKMPLGESIHNLGVIIPRK